MPKRLMTLEDTTYSQRFRDNLEDTLEQMLPVLSFIPFVLTLAVKGYCPEYSWMTCFLAVLGSHVLQILFVVTVNSIPKKDSTFFRAVATAGFYLVPILCLYNAMKS